MVHCGRKRFNSVSSISNIQSTSSNIVGEIKNSKTKSYSNLQTSKNKLKKSSMKYFQMEAEDRDNVSDDEIEDSDADSDDEIFIENDESSEEEGGNLTPKELMALQPRLWNHKKKL